MSINVALVVSALRNLADAFEGAITPQPATAGASAAPATTTRGRGRPAKGESAPAAAASAAPTDDPFSAPAASAVPTATIEEVRKQLTDLKDAVSQEYALKILKDASGVDNLAALKPDKYGVVVQAVKDVMTQKPADAAPPEADDPFALPGEAAPAAEKPLTIENVKEVIVDTQKRTSPEAVQKVVMANGGKAALPTGGEGPSLKALPAANYAKTVAALKALPSTK